MEELLSSSGPQVAEQAFLPLSAYIISIPTLPSSSQFSILTFQFQFCLFHGFWRLNSAWFEWFTDGLLGLILSWTTMSCLLPQFKCQPDSFTIHFRTRQLPSSTLPPNPVSSLSQFWICCNWNLNGFLCFWFSAFWVSMQWNNVCCVGYVCAKFGWVSMWKSLNFSWLYCLHCNAVLNVSPVRTSGVVWWWLWLKFDIKMFNALELMCPFIF